MNDKATKITFHPLKDVPGDKDEFGGGGHERSAAALAADIRAFSEDDRSIGLEGTWGSGKSTVVDIAAAKLEGEAPGKFHFFTYDLWANQTTEFRRAFLEEFLAWIRKHKLLEPDQVDTFENRVRDRIKRIDTSSYRKYSLFGAALVVSIPFFPFFVLWLSPFAANLHHPKPLIDGETTEVELPFIFWFLENCGHWLAIGLLFGIFITFCIDARRIYVGDKKRRFWLALNRALSVFSKKSDVDHVTQNIRDEDPTQYEFRSVFEDILCKVQDSGKRVIFVFDNIDRVPAAKIPDLWSEVRSVFSSTLMGDRPANHKVTAVIPYDKAHILGAFDTDNIPPSNSVSDGIIGDIGLSPVDVSAYIQEDIFRKSFSAIVSVAPPVTTDVEAFFKDKLKQALPDQLNDGQNYRLFQIFDVFLDQLKRPATPRQIKAFVNEVGSLWAQWKGKISIESIGIFVLHRAKLERNPKLLQKPDTIHERLRHYAGAVELDRELAALAYNVEPTLAFEVLLERDFVRAFRDSDSKGLQELVASHPGAFANQVDGILSKYAKIWSSESPEIFIRALNNYIALDVSPSIRSLADKHFRKALSDLEVGQLGEADNLTALANIVECTSQLNLNETTAAFAKWAAKTCVQDAKKSEEKEGRAWIKIVGAYLNAVKAKFGLDEKLKQANQINIPEFGAFRCGVALDCDEVDMRYTQFQRKKRLVPEITGVLNEYVTDETNRFPYIWSEIYPDIPTEQAVSIFEIAVSAARSGKLDESEDQRESIFGNIEAMWGRLWRNPKASAPVNDLISSGVIYWHFDQARDVEDTHTQAVILWLAFGTIGTEEPPGIPTNPLPPFGDLAAPRKQFVSALEGKIDDPVLDKLSDLAVQNKEMEEWMGSACEEPENRSLYGNVFKRVVKSSEFVPPALSSFLVYRTDLKGLLGEDVEVIFERVGQTATDDDISKLELKNLTPGLIQDVQNRTESGWVALIKRVDETLRALTDDEWREAIEKRNENYKRLSARGKSLSGKIPPQHLRVPLLEDIFRILQLGPKDKYETVVQDVLVEALPSATRRKLPDDVFAQLATKETTLRGVSEAAKSYPSIIAKLPVDNDPATSIRKLLLPMMSFDPDQCLSMIGADQSRWRKAVENADDEVKRELEEFLEPLAEPEAEDESESYENRIRSALDLPMRFRKIEEPEDKPSSEGGAGDDGEESDAKKK